ncbi:hypothetical protein CBR_g225 [Chara braunii]|uniref:Peptidase S1 domain-containing protein n=1 Tax=Chara braunii TaxID=69332 RepID=A0A388JLY9_CHABU|nr:hypothetical protein CBR_g225 [Chara braunii]|eukprot:GBG58824.1 hypothetical protein CBR_g225 [Chara braunii]
MNRTELRTVRVLEVWIPRDYVYLDTQTPGGRIFRLSSDLAIAKLAEPLAFSDNVAAIPLSGDESHLRHGSDLTASGWGSILGSGDLAPGHLPQQLQFVTLDHLSDVCDRMYNNDQYTLLGNSSTWYSRREMLCAGCEMGGSGTCNGDSGGPLNIRSSGGCPVQVGVTSFGNHERDVCDLTTFPSVFARVSHLLPWIEHVVGQPVRSTVVPQPTTHCENCLGNDNPAGRECEQAQEYGMHKCVVQSLLASSFILTKPRCNKEGKHRLMAYINFHRGFQNAPEVVKNRMKQGFVFFLRSDQGPGNGILRIPSSYFCHGDRMTCPQSEELINTPLTNPQLLPASGNGYGVAHPAKVRFNKDKGGWLHWSPGCSPQHTYAALYVLVSKESGHPVYLQISLPVGRVPPP